MMKVTMPMTTMTMMKMTMPKMKMTMMTADRVHYNLRLLHLCCTEGTSHAYFSQPDSDHQPCKDDDDHHQPCNDDGDHICPYMQVHLQHQLYRYILSKLTRQKMSSKVYAHNMQVHLQHQYFCPNISRQNIYSQVYAHLCRCISSINFKISRQNISSQVYAHSYMQVHWKVSSLHQRHGGLWHRSNPLPHRGGRQCAMHCTSFWIPLSARIVQKVEFKMTFPATNFYIT